MNSKNRGLMKESLLTLGVCFVLALCGTAATADTGDVTDDFLPGTGAWNCADHGVVVWADVDEDGTYDTQVVFTTLALRNADGEITEAGESAVIPDYSNGKWFFFSFIDSNCGGAAPYKGRGRFSIHFVDILASGFVWDNSATWNYKAVPAVSLRTTHDYCYNWEDDNASLTPYLGVQAYGELHQTDARMPLSEIAAGGWTVHRFSDPAGIKELYISTDYCENTLDDLMLYDHELTDTIPIDYSAGLVLLFDTSGSMNWSHTGAIPVSDEEKRLTMAKDAAIPIVEMMNEHSGDDTNFSIVRFPAQPVIAGECNAEIITPMVGIDDTSAVTAVNTTIPGLSATGMTPLFTGVSTALNRFTDEDRRAVVLLSDGYHNCPHPVNAGDVEVTTVIANALATTASIYSIGFGRPSDVDSSLLDRLATNTGGVFYDVTGPAFDPHTWNPRTALAEAYVTILGDALGLEVGADPRGVIKAGSMQTHEVAISEKDTKVSFYVSWATRQENRLDLRVRASDGSVVPQNASGVKVKQGSTYKVITVSKEYLHLPGKVGVNPWRLEIDANGLSNAPSEYYQYSVLMNSALKMEVNAQTATNSVGEPLTLTATLSLAGQALAGLSDISVKITRPEDGLGNWLATNKVTAAELAKMPLKIGVEPISAVSRKFRFLRDERQVLLPGRSESVTVVLYDDGSHGDSTSNDGVYTNKYTDTLKEGTYSFRFRATGSTSDSSIFQRETHIDKHLAVRVVQEGLHIAISSILSDSLKLHRLKVVITPKDKLGNHVGAGFAKKIHIDAPFGQLVGDVEDNLDGTYTQMVEVPVGMKEAVSIDVNVAGESVSSKWTPPAPENGVLFNWLNLVLIVALVLVLALLLLKRR